MYGILLSYSIINVAQDPKTTNVPHHIETSQLICNANQLIGFYIMWNSAVVVQWLSLLYILWPRGVAVITTAQLHSTKPELKFCAGSIPARGASEIHDGEDL